MSEQIANETEQLPESVNGEQYIEAIAKLKESTVSKEDYAKLQSENKKLLESIINGQNVDIKTQKTEVDINLLRNELFSEDSHLSNLEYVKKCLELREALIEKGNPDPFLPLGVNINPTQEDIDQAQKVADIYKECIEYANGDSEIFTNELMRRTKDAMPNIANKRR